MKIIDRYILKQLKMPILFGVSLFTFIFLIELMLNMMEAVLVKRVPVIDMLHLLTYYIPPILVQTIPIGFFLGVMVTYNKLTSTSESVAMTSMGMSLNKIIKVPFITSIFIFLLTIFLQEKIIPESFLRGESLSIKIATETPSFQLNEKTFINNVGDYNIYINKLDSKANQAKDVVIFQKGDNNTFPNVVLSGTTTWDSGSMTLKDASLFQIGNDGKEKLRGSFKSQVHPLDSFLADFSLEIKKIDTMSVQMLFKEIDKMKKENKKSKEILPYRVELQRKLATPFSAVFLGILGVLFSLGHHRTGKSVSYGLGIGVVFIYITLFNIGLVLASKGTVAPFIGLWMPNILLALLTLILYARKVRRG